MTRNSVMNVLLLSAFFSCCSLMAADNMSFKGTLIEAAACSVNNDERIEIDFGKNLGINKIDGINYRQPVNYTVVCDAGSKAADVYISVMANPMSGDDSAIQSDKSGLGIRLLKDGVAMKIADSIIIDPAHPPVIEAVPVKASGASLTEGAFQATAAFLAEYR